MSADDERALRWAQGTGEPRVEFAPEELCMDTVLVSLALSGLDRSDAAIRAYHATRVPDPAEAQWRTDYTRAYHRRDLAEDQPWRDHPDALWLRARASEIEDRWAADPVIGPRWAELDQLRVGAEYGRPPAWWRGELPTMPGVPAPGMDPVTWRSQCQAHDLTSHGRWPAITTTSNREDTEPMNDITDPQHGAESDETESQTEQQMRADFMYAWGSHSDDPAEYDPADSLDYSEYAGPWLSGDKQWMDEWIYLEDATLRWHDDNLDPDRETQPVDTEALSPVRRRSEEQAQYVAEHGIERDEHGMLNSHYVTRVQERAEILVSPSPLAEFLPGNALAAHAANCERDGIER
ncbi:MAG: hypothetical protein JWN03_6670 [Nocardia sp.]|uniref:hypothetical protein n=1 Tax=Nocardia sp. TaxID=1821 RepID=UPI002614127F|nr:hypothetical protein [Nocardia sp.]MCU1646395.1 hypothetical protein [Nocardia sp.]